MVGGVCPPLEAPLGWLHAAMHSPDLFLYVVVRLDEEGGQGQAEEEWEEEEWEEEEAGEAGLG